MESLYENIKPVAEVKHGNRWIVVTSVNYPTEDVKRLAAIKDWNLVVVGDTKTPGDWHLDNVHFLSVAYQKTLPFSLASSLPYKSYTRKNIGYLYAISQGAEWIYDTDDDNKPYDKLGLEQFDYEETVSGLRYQAKNGNDSSGVLDRLFNPYEFYGVDQMWPRGFPVEHIEKHKNGKDNQVLCYKMKRSAVQQGLVHHDPDVDAIYRLLHADPKTGLNVGFNKFAPPITLSVGSYSPWNSQNTLFHESAFHTLFLPTTVSFRTTDIWRSFISQKILHLSGLTVSFVPTNAVQFRNAHDYLKDFKDENKSMRIQEGLLSFCIIGIVQKAQILKLVFLICRRISFEFPEILTEKYEDPYKASNDETEKNVNCRRMNLEFELVDPKQRDEQSLRKAEQKLNYFGDLVDWCAEAGYSNLLKVPRSAKQLATQHANDYVLQQDLNTVLIVVNNYPWNYGHGLIQRLYQPYFAAVIFCGSWYPKGVKDHDNYTSTINPFNFVHMNPAEMQRGYLGYHCVTLVKEMRMSNVLGYFMMADDAVFNIWQRIDYSRVHHLIGLPKELEDDDDMWYIPQGLEAAKNVLKTIKDSEDPKVEQVWEQFKHGLWTNGYTKNVKREMTSYKGRSFSDFFYIPSSQSEYYAKLMRIFYKNEFFLEIAMNKFLKSVKHQTSRAHLSSYLWQSDRKHWDTLYHKDMVALHPLKLSQFQNPGENRKRYCGSVLQTWADIMIGGSRDFISKADSD